MQGLGLAAQRSRGSEARLRAYRVYIGSLGIKLGLGLIGSRESRNEFRIRAYRV